MRTSAHPPFRLVARVLVASVVVGLITLLGGIAGAHTSLESTDPAAGSTANGPVDAVTLNFTKPVDVDGDEIALLDGAGGDLSVASVSQPVPEQIRIVPSEPLADGEFGVRWAARSVEDGHVLDGSVAFTVAADPGAAAAPSGNATATGGSAAAPSDELAAALDARPSTTAATMLGWLARLLVYASVLFTAGGIVYLRFVHEGSAFETRRIVFWIRRAAVVLVAATVLQSIALLARGHQGSFGSVLPLENWGHTFAGTTGVGLVLAAAGGVAVLLGLRITMHASTRELPLDSPPRGARWSTDEVLGMGTVEASGGGVATKVAVLRVRTTRLRLDRSPVALAGAVAIVASFLFLGHTASEGPWVLTAAADAVHVGAASIWSGGLVLLGAALWRRRRGDDGIPGRLLVARFAQLAAASIVAVALAGLLLSFIILPELSALWSTAFGRLVTAKIVIVGVLAGLGADNHFRTVPRLEADPLDAVAAGRLRQVVLVEAGLLFVVVGLTAALVASSPN